MIAKFLIHRFLCWLGWHWRRWTKDRFDIVFCRHCGLIRRKDGTIIHRVNPGARHWVDFNAVEYGKAKHRRD